MMFPFESLITSNREFGLIIAVVIGFFFGFALERAGFGRATKLAGQFYLHDMTVFKVMFSAIVTAMLGVVILSSVGFMDLRSVSESAVSSTYLWPMLVGGLLLGVGFIVSGYCPGTSAVATASGNLDGLFTLGGVVIGSIIYSAIFPWIESFHNSSNLGHLFLYDLIGLPPEVVAAALAALALGCFLLVDHVEKVFSEKKFGPTGRVFSPAARRIAMGIYGTAAIIALVAMIIPASPGRAERGKIQTITASHLARRTLDEPWKLRIIDMRPRERCIKVRVPGSECVPEKQISQLGLKYSPSQQDLVLITDTLPNQIPEFAVGYPGEILFLKGGFGAWKQFALTPPEAPPASATFSQTEAYRFRAAYHQMLTGVKQAPPPPRPSTTYTPKKKKRGGGCG